MTLDVRPLTPVIGAEVSGVDLAADLDDPNVVASIRAAFIEHRALVFRDQRLDRDRRKAFGRLFGELAVHPSRRGPDVDDPEIFVVRADETSRLNNAGLWHTYLSCNEVPPLGSMLLLACRHDAVWDYWPGTREGERVNIGGVARPTAVGAPS